MLTERGQNGGWRRGAVAAIAWLALALIPALAHAHGETARGGVGGGGINTVGGTVPPPGAWGLGLRFEMRQYEEFSDAQLLDFARSGEDVHQHSQELSAFLSSSFALSDAWAIDFSLPINAFRNFREGALDESGDAVLEVDDFSAGVGDLLVLGRYQPLHAEPHHLALLAGIKLPTGNTRQTNNEGERLGAHNQPGSGSIDFQLGVGYTLEVGHFALAADIIASIRTPGATDFQSGNALQADLAASYEPHPVALVMELNGIVSERDIEHGEILDNSGIRTLYLSPGFAGGGRPRALAVRDTLLPHRPGAAGDPERRDVPGELRVLGELRGRPP